MPDARTDMLEDRIDKLETKVDNGFAQVNRRFDEVYEGMSQGFAEHRRLLIEQMDRRVEPLGRDVKRLDGRINQLGLDVKADLEREVGSLRAEMRTGFDAVAARLDAFIDSQAAVNRKLLAYLADRQADSPS